MARPSTDFDSLPSLTRSSTSSNLASLVSGVQTPPERTSSLHYRRRKSANPQAPPIYTTIPIAKLGILHDSEDEEEEVVHEFTGEGRWPVPILGRRRTNEVTIVDSHLTVLRKDHKRRSRIAGGLWSAEDLENEEWQALESDDGEAKSVSNGDQAAMDRLLAALDASLAGIIASPPGSTMRPSTPVTGVVADDSMGGWTDPWAEPQENKGIEQMLESLGDSNGSQSPSTQTFEQIQRWRSATEKEVDVLPVIEILEEYFTAPEEVRDRSAECRHVMEASEDLRSLIATLPDIPLSNSRISCDSFLLDSPDSKRIFLPAPPNSPSSSTPSSPNPWTQFFHPISDLPSPELSPTKSHDTSASSDTEDDHGDEYSSTPVGRPRNFSLPSSGALPSSVVGNSKGKLGEVFAAVRTGRWRSFSEGEGSPNDGDGRGGWMRW